MRGISREMMGSASRNVGCGIRRRYIRRGERDFHFRPARLWFMSYLQDQFGWPWLSVIVRTKLNSICQTSARLFRTPVPLQVSLICLFSIIRGIQVPLGDKLLCSVPRFISIILDSPNFKNKMLLP